jgi:hypothetical protein
VEILFVSLLQKDCNESLIRQLAENAQILQILTLIQLQ